MQPTMMLQAYLTVAYRVMQKPHVDVDTAEANLRSALSVANRLQSKNYQRHILRALNIVRAIKQRRV